MTQENTRANNDDQILRAYITRNIWNFPRIVAKQNGYFSKEGINIEFIERPLSETEDVDIYERKDKRMFENADTDIYSACVWGTIKKTWDSPRGKIVAHKAVLETPPYTIFTRSETNISDPNDLTGVPVGIRNHAGSHYATIENLENHINQEQIKVTHFGRPINRLKALYHGEIDAATLMGPVISMANQLEMEKVMEFSHGGAVIASDELTEENIRAYINAMNHAIKNINNNPDEHKQYFVKLAKNELQAEQEFQDLIDVTKLIENITTPHYSQGFRPVNEDDIENKLQWMKRHGLIPRKANMNQLVLT